MNKYLVIWYCDDRSEQKIAVIDATPDNFLKMLAKEEERQRTLDPRMNQCPANSYPFDLHQVVKL